VGHGTIQIGQCVPHHLERIAQQFVAHLFDEHHRLDRAGRPHRTYKEALERFIHDYLPALKPPMQGSLAPPSAN
jgi:Ni,Fe-hydrogenase I small subunit